MSKDELLDLVSRKDEVIGTVRKSKAHSDPSIIHREVAVAVFTKQGETLLQKRSMKKKYDPGVWQIASAGHVAVGENPKESAERELSEEVGLKVKLRYIDKLFSGYKKESRFFWIYYAILDEKVPLTVDKNEVEEARWVKIENLNKYFEGESFAERASPKILFDVIKQLKLK